jgi:hypothetical protein
VRQGLLESEAAPQHPPPEQQQEQEPEGQHPQQLKRVQPLSEEPTEVQQRVRPQKEKPRAEQQATAATARVAQRAVPDATTASTREDVPPMEPLSRRVVHHPILAIEVKEAEVSYALWLRLVRTRL